MAAPSLRRRRLARALQQLREGAGLSITDAARLAGFSQAKLSRIELAQISISGDDTYELCRVLGVGDDMTTELVALARHAKRRDWWHPYPNSVLGMTTNLLELESDADNKYCFTVDVLPGSLQTEAYVRELMRHGFPRESDEDIQRRVDIRLARQRYIAAGTLETWAIIDEAALRRPVGGAAMHVAQLDYLAQAAAGRNVSIQVLPASVPCHIAMSVPFSMFTLRDGFTCVCLDTLNGGIYLEDEAEVRIYRETWSKLAAIALSFEESAAQLAEIAAEYRSESGEPRTLRVAKEPGEH